MNICRIISETLNVILTNGIVFFLMAIVVLERLVRGKRVRGIIKTYIKCVVIMFVFSILADVIPVNVQVIAVIISVIIGLSIFFVV